MIQISILTVFRVLSSKNIHLKCNIFITLVDKSRNPAPIVWIVIIVIIQRFKANKTSS